MANPKSSISEKELDILLAQYDVVAGHHMHFMGLIWQLPALTITVIGALVAVLFGYELSAQLRGIALLFGAAFLFIMVVAVERYRMFQLRRRKDLERIEARLVELGGMAVAWSGDEIAGEIKRGSFQAPGVRFYQTEGFRMLRAFMYLFLFVTAGLAAWNLNLAWGG